MNEIQYKEPENDKLGPLTKISETIIDEIGTVGYIDDGLGIHMVENKSDKIQAATLHLYTPAYEKVKIWDEKTGKSEWCMPQNYSINGVLCKQPNLNNLIVEPAINIQNLIVKIDRLTEAHKNYNSKEFQNAINHLLVSYRNEDWKKYLFYNDKIYTRNCVYSDPDGKFELLVLGWNCNQKTPIHNHPGAQCYYKLLAGEMYEVSFQEPEEGKFGKLVKIDEDVMSEIGTVGYIDDGMGIHYVENRSSKVKAATLHLYLPSYGKVKVWDETSGDSKWYETKNYSLDGEIV